MDFDEENDTIAPMLADLGGELALTFGPDHEGLLLYVEAGDRWYSYSLWQVEGDTVRSEFTTREIDRQVNNIRDVLPPQRRWSKLILSVEGTRFNAKFGYPDEDNVEVGNGMDRADAVVREYFPDKRLVPAPLPDWAKPNPPDTPPLD